VEKTQNAGCVRGIDNDRTSDWFACDAKTGQKRLLFHGGYEGHISADGRYLLVVHTRTEVFVALISIDSGNVLDLKQAADFQTFAQAVNGLDTLSFDPQHAVLQRAGDLGASFVCFQGVVGVRRLVTDACFPIWRRNWPPQASFARRAG
jgi:hypothetical protein